MVTPLQLLILVGPVGWAILAYLAVFFAAGAWGWVQHIAERVR